MARRPKAKTARAPKGRPTTIDDYLKTVDPDKRAALERVRAIIQAAAPGSEESISYGVPAFRLDGKILLWFAAAKSHCSLFPGTVLAEFDDELAGFETSKGTIRFQPDRPLPAALIRKLMKARIARHQAGIGVRSKKSMTGKAKR